MRNRVMVLCLGFLVISTSVIHGEEWSKQDKLISIEREIAEAKSERKTGLMMMGGGLGLVVIGYAAFLPTYEYEYSYENGEYTDDSNTEGNSTMFVICVIGGLVVETWGAYKWWGAAQTLSQLKAKRYDISLKPILNKSQMGLALNVKY